MCEYNYNDIISFTSDVLKRYVPDINSGTFFLYNARTKIFWTGNSSAYYILKIFDGQRTLNEVYDIVAPIFCDFSLEEVKKNVDIILNELIAKEFMKVGSIAE